MTSPAKIQSPKRDPFVITGFVLAVMFMILPVEADIVPFFVGLRRQRLESLAGGGRRILIATGVILALNVVWLSFVLIYNLTR